VFYSTYELQVAALVAGEIDLAWNSPLAWIDAQRQTGGTCRAIAMRDTDRDRVTHLVVRRDGGIYRVDDLRQRTVALGALDSPQATLLPLHHLAGFGLLPDRDFTVRRHDVLVGKHGDHVGGERDAVLSVSRGETAAAAVLDLNWAAWQADGTADPGLYTVLTTTAPFDHCNFTVLDRFPADRERQWTDVLFRMRYDNPAHREMMDLEGLKAWLPGRTSGYAALAAATAQVHFFEERTV
jgi:ABC-type phosphate/phosphonate transport system substrate-binding protein